MSNKPSRASQTFVVLAFAVLGVVVPIPHGTLNAPKFAATRCIVRGLVNRGLVNRGVAGSV